MLSHAYTKAIRWGLADDNPCRQVERNKEKPDDRYITDTEFMAVYRLAPGPVRDAMAIAYITGQRQADVLSGRLHCARPSTEPYGAEALSRSGG